MQRGGHEGYPVGQDGKGIGLLNRRAVDRALSHKLNLPASSLMEAGEVTVSPDDSIQHVQRLMTDTGWGQVPVVDLETGEVIGIVTRTDLLKTLVPQEPTEDRGNLGPRLEAALPPARLALVKAIAEIARAEQSALYIVGGYVRDLLLERPGIDFDLVVEGDAILLARQLSRRFGGRVTSHTQFGTAKWLLPLQVGEQGKPADDNALQSYFGSPDLPATVDLVSARTEFYTHPTALPTVERSSIKLDLHRRDFTINTLAIRLDGRHWGELHDYWGGLNDLRQELVRCLHSLSFVDDPTRMLRAVRFEQRFGFRIENRTLHLLNEALSLLERVSGDRIRHELDHMLDEERAPEMLLRASELGLLHTIHPSLFWDQWIDVRFRRLSALDNVPAWMQEEFPYSEISAAQANPRLQWGNVPVRRALGYLLWFMRLPEKEGESALRRLKIARLLRNEIQAASALWLDLPSLVGAPPSAAAARLDEISPLALYAVFLAAENDGQRLVLQKYITGWRKISTSITGRDLKAHGLPPGPHYKSILLALRAAWLDGRVSNETEEKAYLQELLRQAETAS
jgi:tRNA nucleotidyltransferase (CCA-adding enzyme)